MLKQVQNEEWLLSACNIWDGYAARCKWTELGDAMLNINPAKGKLVDYVRAVMEIAFQAAGTMRSVYGLSIDMDVLLLSCFLHDACKLLEYEPCEGGYRKSHVGQIYQHGFLSAHDALNAGLPPAVISNILCHTPQSNHALCTVEGHLMAHADRAITSSLETAAGRK